MDELFGAERMSDVEDIGVAAKQAKKLVHDEERVEHVNHATKV